MSLFIRKDPRLAACADPSWGAVLFKTLRRHAGVGAALLLVACMLYAANVAAGLRAHARESGTIEGLTLDRAVILARDRRGVPHIRASTLHDLFFAQGFAEGSDRLFQVDVTRRYAYGRLAEVFGPKALALDEDTRPVDIAAIARREWRAADKRTRDAVEAFSAGVNAAEEREPLPVEFRMLLYRPAPWTPEDSIAVSLVASLELSDSWHEVFVRDDRWRSMRRRCFERDYPLSDPQYDVSFAGTPVSTGIAAGPIDCANAALAGLRLRPRMGSNAWASGAARTRGERAMLANDPHVDLTIPGVWYLVDLDAPGFHAAGATLPGLPGVVLGHNERLAWGATNAEAANTIVYRSRAIPRANRVVERFEVRFSRTVSKAYYRTKTEFSVPDDANPTRIAFVRWPVYWQSSCAISTILGLDRAGSIRTALRVLAAYRGAPQNFVLADTSGAIAYHMAGLIPNDPAWGRFVHPLGDMRDRADLIPFSRLPASGVSRDGIVVSANNKMYGREYPYRLSAAFEAPYRAYRIGELLRQRRRYDAAYFARMQLDTLSPIDLEVARNIVRAISAGSDDLHVSAGLNALSRWNGRFDETSTTASLVHALRAAVEDSGPPIWSQQNGLRCRANCESADLAWKLNDALSSQQRAVAPWGRVGAVEVDHPLSPMWYGLLRGKAFPGNGDEYTIRLQEPGFAQGFRAVWDVGNWDAGGIVIPNGESGEPGSPHYDDLARDWIDGALRQLPFSKTAIARQTTATLILR